jgi:hypothetical protein
MKPAAKATRNLAAVWILAGAALLFAAWSLPVNLKSVSPALLEAAGRGTPGVGIFGRDLVDYEKLGPASMVLQVARELDDPRAGGLADAIAAFGERQPELVPWGGWDPFLDPLFDPQGSRDLGASTPVLHFLIPSEARRTLLGFLQNSRSQGVISLLELRGVTSTGRFSPATQAGGQPLDAILLLSALLYQGDHFSPPLQRELRTLADNANASGALGDLEPFFIDLLSLGQRLDWMQLTELLRRTQDTGTVSQYAHLSRVAPDQVPLIYTAALFSNSADLVARYLLEYGSAGVEDLKVAIAHGQGAAALLLERQVPLNRGAVAELSAAATFGLLHPRAALVIKWLGFLAGAFLLLRGLDRLFFSADSALGAPLPHLRGGVLALLVAGLLVLVTEPFLLQAAPLSEYRVRLVLPVLAAADSAAPKASANPPANIMESSTLLSIGFFAALQVGMYLICLLKIREIEGRLLPPLTKLRLMENEENLFDGGLYVGIGGTAAALVFQVLGIIEPNLLAAYSSNLFGITCVALVKIRHVRPYKCRLILQGESKLATA